LLTFVVGFLLVVVLLLLLPLLLLDVVLILTGDYLVFDVYLYYY
jgi:hypothetical protein